MQCYKSIARKDITGLERWECACLQNVVVSANRLLTCPRGRMTNALQDKRFLPVCQKPSQSVSKLRDLSDQSGRVWASLIKRNNSSKDAEVAMLRFSRCEGPATIICRWQIYACSSHNITGDVLRGLASSAQQASDQQPSSPLDVLRRCMRQDNGQLIDGQQAHLVPGSKQTGSNPSSELQRPQTSPSESTNEGAAAVSGIAGTARKGIQLDREGMSKDADSHWMERRMPGARQWLQRKNRSLSSASVGMSCWEW